MNGKCGKRFFFAMIFFPFFSKILLLEIKTKIQKIHCRMIFRTSFTILIIHDTTYFCNNF